MNRRYEALLVLNTQAKDENVKEMIERLESEFEKEGAKVEQVQKMDKRHFSYMAGSLDSGYYVNFILNTDPGSIVLVSMPSRHFQVAGAQCAVERNRIGSD